MDDKQFKMLLEKGLDLIYTNDKDLLDRAFNINERTITHKLALHLTFLFVDYDVDCEYNRMITDRFGNYSEGDYWTKTINISIDDCVSCEDDEAKTVFPDIIIHKRKQQVNLAVIEVKMQWKNSRKDFDYRKLKAYKTDLKYKYAVYLELDETKYLLDFINN